MPQSLMLLDLILQKDNGSLQVTNALFMYVRIVIHTHTIEFVREKSKRITMCVENYLGP